MIPQLEKHIESFGNPFGEQPSVATEADGFENDFNNLQIALEKKMEKKMEEMTGKVKEEVLKTSKKLIQTEIDNKNKEVTNLLSECEKWNDKFQELQKDVELLKTKDTVSKKELEESMAKLEKELRESYQETGEIKEPAEKTTTLWKFAQWSVGCNLYELRLMHLLEHFLKIY